MEDEPLPRLRMASPESPEELGRRLRREKAAHLAQREAGASLEPFRVGSVPYLNAAPLVRGIEDQIILAPPSELAQMLQRDELDAALVSVTEVLLQDRYDILDGVAVASLGEVRSVFLAHDPPLNEVEVVHCDPASLTSVNLLRVLLAEKGIRPEFRSLESYDPATFPANVLLIGDPAIAYALSNPKKSLWDLGSAWYELTNLPFVYAVWALTRGRITTPLRRELKAAKALGMETIDSIIRNRTEFDFDFRHDYLTWHIHYHLGEAERQGLAKFVELLRKHLQVPVYDPRYL